MQWAIDWFNPHCFFAIHSVQSALLQPFAFDAVELGDESNLAAEVATSPSSSPRFVLRTGFLHASSLISLLLDSPAQEGKPSERTDSSSFVPSQPRSSLSPNETLPFAAADPAGTTLFCSPLPADTPPAMQFATVAFAISALVTSVAGEHLPSLTGVHQLTIFWQLTRNLLLLKRSPHSRSDRSPSTTARPRSRPTSPSASVLLRSLRELPLRILGRCFWIRRSRLLRRRGRRSWSARRWRRRR